MDSGLAALGVPPEGGPIYEVALTHRSFAYEQPTTIEHNERLEFLGDSVLGMIVTDLIFTTYPDLSEGELARLRASVVNTQALAELAGELELGEHIRLGKGEEASGGRAKPSLLADTLEAVIGAVYVDRGIETVRSQLVPLFATRIGESVGTGDRYDAKTALQEVAVRDRGGLPVYRVASTGPDHDKRFSAEVYLEDSVWGRGSGRSKKDAEQEAAREALRRLETTADEPEVHEGPGHERGEDARAS